MTNWLEPRRKVASTKAVHLPGSLARFRDAPGLHLERCDAIRGADDPVGI